MEKKDDWKFKRRNLEALQKQWLLDIDIWPVSYKHLSTGDECSIIIEDGYVKDKSGVTVDKIVKNPDTKPTWKAGEF